MDLRYQVVLVVLMSARLADAQLGPFIEADLQYSAHVCSDTTYATLDPQTGFGTVQDLNAANQGCILTNERQGVWMHFQVATSGKVGFAVVPSQATDLDLAVWGPFTAPPTALAGPPIRCSWSALYDTTGLNFVAVDQSEGAGGDGWVRYLDVLAGQWYQIYLDNYAMIGVGFSLTWQFQDGASIQCLAPPEAAFIAPAPPVLPAEDVSFTDQSTNYPYAWYWEFPGGTPSTSTERNPLDIVFPAPGCYDVSLTAYNAAGSSTTTGPCAVNVEVGTGLEASTVGGCSFSQDADRITLRHFDADARCEVLLVDATGRTVRSLTGRGTLMVATADLRAGAYTLVVRASGRRAMHRIIVTR